MAYELLGDIAYYEQKLGEAKDSYQRAYQLTPSERLKEKIEKTRREKGVERSMATAREKHFIIKYHNSDQQVDGFELRELLRRTYRQISKDFAYYLHQKVVVLLYDFEDFQEISQLPHWAAGGYDGKVRMPINRKGYSEKDLEALTVHEVTHAFVAAMSGRRAPAWINEGLAEYEENKIKPTDTRLFQASFKRNQLFPLSTFLNSAPGTLGSGTAIQLYYQQAYILADYLVERYGMFRLKQLLQAFKTTSNSEEALRNVLKISPQRLEEEWKRDLAKKFP